MSFVLFNLTGGKEEDNFGNNLRRLQFVEYTRGNRKSNKKVLPFKFSIVLRKHKKRRRILP